MLIVKYKFNETEFEKKESRVKTSGGADDYTGFEKILLMCRTAGKKTKRGRASAKKSADAAQGGAAQKSPSEKAQRRN